MPAQYNPDKHHRRSIRLKGYDYTSAGSYFITICTHQRQCLFGEIIDGQMTLNKLGQIATDCWQVIPDHFPHTHLDTFVVMPNHLHGILVMIDDRSYLNTHPLRSNSGKGIALQCPYDNPRSPNDKPSLNKREFEKMIPGSLPTIVRSYKSATTKYINLLRNTPGTPIWQRNYYEHIIRDEPALQNIRQYIQNNPSAWQKDKLYAKRTSKP